MVELLLVICGITLAIVCYIVHQQGKRIAELEKVCNNTGDLAKKEVKEFAETYFEKLSEMTKNHDNLKRNYSHIRKSMSTNKDLLNAIDALAKSMADIRRLQNVIGETMTGAGVHMKNVKKIAAMMEESTDEILQTFSVGLDMIAEMKGINRSEISVRIKEEIKEFNSGITEEEKNGE